jgi:hypothetical protein
MRLLIALVTDTRKAYWHRWIMWIFANVRSICSVFELEALTAWQEVAADVTFYFGWSDERAWGMTQKRLLWWVAQAKRINKLKSGDQDDE